MPLDCPNRVVGARLFAEGRRHSGQTTSPAREVLCDPFISTLAASMAFGLLLGTLGASALNGSVGVVPDANRTKAFFIEIVSAGGSFTIPTLKGLTGTITYYSIQPDEKAKVYTA